MWGRPWSRAAKFVIYYSVLTVFVFACFTFAFLVPLSLPLGGRPGEGPSDGWVLSINIIRF